MSHLAHSLLQIPQENQTDSGLQEIRKLAKQGPNPFSHINIYLDLWEVNARGNMAKFYRRLSYVGKDKALVMSKKGEIIGPGLVVGMVKAAPDPELFPGSIMQFVRGLAAPSWADEDDD